MKCRSCKKRDVVGDRTLCTPCINILRIEVETLHAEYCAYAWRRLGQYTIRYEFKEDGVKFVKAPKEKRTYYKRERTTHHDPDEFWVEAERRATDREKGPIARPF